MVNRVFSILIPTRFIVTIAHLITIIMIFQARSDHVRAALPLVYDDSTYTTYDNSLLACLILTVIGIGVDLIGLFTGATMFIGPQNVFQIFSNFVATVLSCVFIMDNWHYAALWYIFGFFVAPVAVVEALLFFGVLFFRHNKY